MPRAIATKQYHDFTGGLNTDSTKLNFPENSLVDVRNIILEKSGKVRRAKYGTETAVGQTLTAIASDPHTGMYVWNNPAGISDKNFLVLQYGENLYFYDLDLDDTSYEVSDNYVGTVAIDLSLDEDLLSFVDINGRLVVTASPSGGISQAQYITYTSPSTFAATNLSMNIRDFEGLDDGYRPEEQRDYTGDCFLVLTGVTGTYVATNTINGSTSGAGVGTIVSWTGGTNVLRVTTTTDMTIGETITDAGSGATGTLAIQVPVMDDYNTSAVNKHLYNLMNQGWDTENITKYTLAQSKEPSNAMQWILGKDTSTPPVLDPDLLDSQDWGTALAPKGRAIYDLRLGTTDESFIENDINVLDTIGGISNLSGVNFNSLASSAGRLWLSGGGDEGNKNVYFTQIVKEDLSNLSKAYQEQDPTAEDFNALLDTDGGRIPIKEANNIIKLMDYQNGVMAFANNGVWFIGAPDTGFTPTNYFVRKITDSGITSARTTVKVKDSVFYWSTDGIIAIQPDPESGYLTATDITEGKINELYTGKQSLTFTPTYTDKTKAWGAYDNVDKRIYWGYDQTASTNKQSAQKLLVYDVDLAAFTLLDSPSSIVHGAFNREHDGIKFLFLNKTSGVVAEFINMKGSTFFGTTGTTYFETFHEHLGDTVRNKAATWVVCQFERTEDGYQSSGGGTVFTNPSGCFMRAKWEWTDLVDAGRWSDLKQVYRLPRLYVPTGPSDPFDYGHTVITTKNKVRGHGKAISLRFEAEDSKDFVLLGWAATYTADGII